MTSAERDLERVLPRIVSAYRKGRLVPFTGGGLSAPACESWPGLVTSLEREARITAAPPSAGNPPQELIRRANRAVRRLRTSDPEHFPAAVRRALRVAEAAPGPMAAPPQTTALARLWWPLVITTNYDDLFLTSFEMVHGRRQMDVVGRSPTDCQRVLDALYAPSSALLWALQGFFLGISSGEEVKAEHPLVRELVVGHEEYRRVTHREPHFRRAFGEVFRARSFLFVGSGLKEVYVLELLGEVLELLGASANPNFAFVKRGEVDPGFLYARFETMAIEYDDHAEVPGLLNRIADVVEQERARIVRWRYAAPGRARNEQSSLEIVRGRLPMPRTEECVALSVGGARTMVFLGRSSRAYLEDLGVVQKGAVHVAKPGAPAPASGPYALPLFPRAEAPPEGNQGWRVARLPNVPAYLVRARTEKDEYALGLIAGAFEDLLTATAADGFETVRTTLIASGGRKIRQGTSSPEYHRRPYPAYYALIQMLRAYARFTQAVDAPLRVVIYVVDRSVSFELESGRLDVTDLLTSDERLRFWTEARLEGGSLDRRLMTADENTTIGDIADALDLPLASWLVDVVPLPRLGAHTMHRIEEAHALTLADLDVVPGATLRFRPFGG